jgi:hypothetical protein
MLPNLLSRHLLTFPSAVALALFLAACGGGEDDAAGVQTATDQAASVQASAADSQLDAAASHDAGHKESLADALLSGSTQADVDAGEIAAAAATDATVVGPVSAPYPTLQNLSLEWRISGDGNLNGVVQVRYRKAGTSAWSNAMALRRIPAGNNAGFSWANRHSGSVFDLQPNTSYEIELSLVDPDGGSAVRTLTARTRAVPAPMAGAPVKAVTPGNFASVASAAKAGDILQLGAGNYPGFTFNNSGTAGKPIVIRSTAGAVINGNIDMFDRAHVHLSGLTVKGRIRFNHSSNIAITRCDIKASSDGIVAYLGSDNSYIADNIITGVTKWAESSLGVNGNNVGEGVVLTGPGHVVMNNRVSGFRDDISLLEGSEAENQYSIDVLNNDLRNAADDAVEADYCFHNCRIMRNRVTNAFMGMSSQPSLGGPTYFVRNAMYNVVLSAFKLHNGSTGDVILHNTVVKNGDALGIYAGAPIRRAVMLNNLFIGGPGGTYNGYQNGSGRVASVVDLDTKTSRLDHDAFGSTSGSFSGRLGATSFASLTALRSATTEKHAVQVTLASFAGGVAFPAAPMTAYALQDLRLAAGSPAANAALPIANINDGFSGAAPDMGAYEGGAALPVYGPR